MNVRLTSLKIKEYKNEIVLGVKSFLLLWMLSSLLFTFEAPYTRLTTIFPILFITFMMSSVIYYTYTSNGRDRRILMSMWKTYFPIISLMIVLMYSIEFRVADIHIDYLKTKLDYEIKMKSSDINKSFSIYDQTVEDYLIRYQREDYNESNVFKEKQSEKEEKPYKIWYANFAVSVMNIITLFMFMWGLVELSIFKNNQQNRGIGKNRIKKKFLKLP